MAKILVVDDEAEARNAVDLMLSLEGHVVTACGRWRAGIGINKKEFA